MFSYHYLVFFGVVALFGYYVSSGPLDKSYEKCVLSTSPFSMTAECSTLTQELDFEGQEMEITLSADSLEPVNIPFTVTVGECIAKLSYVPSQSAAQFSDDAKIFRAPVTVKITNTSMFFSDVKGTASNITCNANFSTVAGKTRALFSFKIATPTKLIKLSIKADISSGSVPDISNTSFYVPIIIGSILLALIFFGSSSIVYYCCYYKHRMVAEKVEKETPQEEKDDADKKDSKKMKDGEVPESKPSKPSKSQSKTDPKLRRPATGRTKITQKAADPTKPAVKEQDPEMYSKEWMMRDNTDQINLLLREYAMQVTGTNLTVDESVVKKPDALKKAEETKPKRSPFEASKDKIFWNETKDEYFALADYAHMFPDTRPCPKADIWPRGQKDKERRDKALELGFAEMKDPQCRKWAENQKAVIWEKFAYDVPNIQEALNNVLPYIQISNADQFHKMLDEDMKSIQLLLDACCLLLCIFGYRTDAHHGDEPKKLENVMVLYRRVTAIWRMTIRSVHATFLSGPTFRYDFDQHPDDPMSKNDYEGARLSEIASK